VHVFGERVFFFLFASDENDKRQGQLL
jgi:hypothetical protein